MTRQERNRLWWESLSEESRAAIRERLRNLPPLPADWMPVDAEQQRRFVEMRESQRSAKAVETSPCCARTSRGR